MSNCTLLESSVTYIRKECFDLLKYAKANREDGIFNDVTVQTGHLCIGANRMVLSCYSTFFEKMFNSEMRERYESSITIDLIESTVVKRLIDYMYDGSITIDYANVMDILAAADFFQMAEVKLFCFEFLKERISSDNWYAVLLAAKFYRCDQLQKHSYQFIGEHLDDIADSADFKVITKDDLTSLISNLRENKKTVDESAICILVIDWTKQDEEERKAVFADLFQMICLENLSLHFLEYLFENALVKNHLVCVNAITVALFNMRKKNEQDFLEYKSLRVVSIGGRTTSRNVVEIFNLSKKGEQKYPDLPYSVHRHCSVKLDGIVYSIGGCDPGNFFNVYDKVCRMNLNETNLRWKKIVSLNEKRFGMSAAVYNRCLVVAGGSNGRYDLKSTEYSIDPSNKWEMGPTLLNKRCANALAECSGSLYALGGFDGTTCLSSVEQLRSLYGGWQNVAPMLTPRLAFAVVSLNGCMYAIGGRSARRDNSALKTVERYDPGLNTWTCVSGMRYKRSFHCACVCEGKICVFGGLDHGGNVIKEIECYDPSKDEWRIVENLKHRLFDFAVFSH